MSNSLYKKGRGIIFAKNSGRDPNEPNLTLFIPATVHRKGDVLKCTQIEIPEIEKTNAVLLCKSMSGFGAEMGINNHSLVVGSEAVFTRCKEHRARGLLGPEMARIALERSASAKEATKLIISLLETYGQGGTYDGRLHANSSFLIADVKEAYILETAGNFYALKKVDKQVGLGNRLQITDDYIKTNMPLGEIGLFKRIGFTKEKNAGDSFKAKFVSPFFSFFLGSKARADVVSDALTFTTFEHEFEDVIRILKSHEEINEKTLFTKGSEKSVCMHAGAAHTTGSMVVTLRENKPATIWVTGSGTPCLSLYKPVFFGLAEAPVFLSEDDSFAFWRDRELVHRAVFAGHINAGEFRSGIEKIQSRLIEEERRIFAGDPAIHKLTDFMRRSAQAEMMFYHKYDKIKRAMQNGELKLPKKWQRLTAKLKKRYFM